MLRSILLATAAVALLLSSSANACRCPPPPPLSECEVRDDAAAILVTIKCVKTVICDINTGVAVADVVIDKIFQDNTGLGLKVGDMTTISSSTQGSICGIGTAFSPGDRWIMFADPFFIPKGGRRRQQDGVFSDGSICDVSEAVLETNSCSGGNIKLPGKTQIKELMLGCAN